MAGAASSISVTVDAAGAAGAPGLPEPEHVLLLEGVLCYIATPDLRCVRVNSRCCGEHT